VFALGSNLTPMETPFQLITNLNVYTPLQLKRMGLDISTSFVKEDTFLISAIQSSDIIRVKALLEVGVNVNCRSLWGNSRHNLPLAVAVCIHINYHFDAHSLQIDQAVKNYWRDEDQQIVELLIQYNAICSEIRVKDAIDECKGDDCYILSN
jgi:hypothetical protein